MNPVDIQQSLRQRLLLAISTGALLAAPGCAGKTSPDPGDSSERGPDGTGTSESGGAGGVGAAGSVTGAGGVVSGFGPGGVGAAGSVTGAGGVVSGFGPGGVGAAGSVTGAGGVVSGFGPGGVGAAGSVTGAGGVGVTVSVVGTTVSPSIGGIGGAPNYECAPPTFVREFCLTREAMEEQARYGGPPQIPKVPVRSDEEVAGGWDENGCIRHDWISSGCCYPSLEPGIPVGDECCYAACEYTCCGRPLVLSGQAITAAATSRSDWVTLKLDTLGDARQAPRALAELWQADALAEHASVASFARFTLQLLALAAPSELVLDAQRAALDEVDHARRCFDIASRLSGRLIGPGRLAEASASVATDLAEVVVATIHEGCVGETLAAAMASEQARVAEDPEVRASLLKIAEDEARHAELAWRFVAWALQGADARVRRLTHQAFSQALARTEWPLDPARLAIDPSSLHRWGQLAPDESKAVARHTLINVVSPAAERLLASGDREGQFRQTWSLC